MQSIDIIYDTKILYHDALSSKKKLYNKLKMMVKKKVKLIRRPNFPQKKKKKIDGRMRVEKRD